MTVQADDLPFVSGAMSAIAAGGIKWFSGRYGASPAIGAGIILKGRNAK